MFAITSVLRRCSQISLVSLVSCKLNSETINIFYNGIQSTEVKINRLNITGNEVTDDAFAVVCSIFRQCDAMEVAMNGCIAERIQNFGKEKLKRGRLSIWGRKLEINEISALGSILCHYDEMEEVAMQRCQLQADGMKSFMEAIGDIKVKHLDVSENRNLGKDGWRTIGYAVQKNAIQELKIRNCDLSADEIENLQEALGDSKIKLLDVSRNQDKTSDFWRVVGSIVNKCQVEELKMINCKLSTAMIEGFQEGLNSWKIKILDVSLNSNLGTAAWSAISCMVRKVEAQELKVIRCDLSTQEIEALREGLSRSKITKLEIAVPDHASSDYIEAVANLVHWCHHLQRLIVYGARYVSNKTKHLIEMRAGNAAVTFE